MGCGKYRDRLGAYRDGELSPTEAGEVSEHIAHCSDCRETARQIGRMGDLLRLATDESASPFFETRFWSAVSRANARSRGGWRPFLTPARGLVGAAAVVALVTGISLLRPSEETASTLVAQDPPMPRLDPVTLTDEAGSSRTLPRAPDEPEVPDSWGPGTRVEGYWAREAKDGAVHWYLVGEVQDGARLQRVSF